MTMTSNSSKELFAKLLEDKVVQGVAFTHSVSKVMTRADEVHSRQPAQSEPRKICHAHLKSQSTLLY